MTDLYDLAMTYSTLCYLRKSLDPVLLLLFRLSDSPMCDSGLNFELSLAKVIEIARIEFR